MSKSYELTQKFELETNRALHAVEEKMKSINVSLKLLKGTENSIARTALSDHKRALKMEQSGLWSLLSKLEESE